MPKRRGKMRLARKPRGKAHKTGREDMISKRNSHKRGGLDGKNAIYDGKLKATTTETR